jgi:hypothetical protein
MEAYFMKSTSLALSFTAPNQERSRQRLRTERKALDFLSSKLDLPPARRLKARHRIRSAKQPAREARRIISESLGHANDNLKAGLDHSDVHELRVKLLRKDLVLCPEQSDWLNRLDRQIAAGTITRAGFDTQAENLLLMENSLPLQHRKAERDFNYLS